MVISQVESRQPKQVEFRFHPFNETSPLRSQVQSWCAHDRKPLRFSFQGGLPVVEKYRADLQLLGEDDRSGFAGLKTGLLLDPGDSLRVFDAHSLDPISRGFR